MSGSVDTEHCISNNKALESSDTSSKGDPEPSAPVINRGSNELPSRSVYLSNRERLLLRKQALKMTKRPVLAIGIVSSFINLGYLAKSFCLVTLTSDDCFSLFWLSALIAKTIARFSRVKIAY